MSELKWNVWISHRYTPDEGIQKYNIFDHWRFRDDVVKLVKKYVKLRIGKGPEAEQAEADNRAAFLEGVRRELMYYFWSKCEWEIVLTHWPPAVGPDRNTPDAWDRFNRESRKIDVYEQVLMNWDAFCDYLWSHKRMLRELGRKEEKEGTEDEQTT